jgi:hypothetical protein
MTLVTFRPPSLRGRQLADEAIRFKFPQIKKPSHFWNSFLLISSVMPFRR